VKNLFCWKPGVLKVTHEELRRLFETYGQVVQVHIIVDRDTGLPRGFAFVEMTTRLMLTKHPGSERQHFKRSYPGRELRSTQTRTPSSIGEREPRRRGRRGVWANVSGPAPGSRILWANCGRSLSFSIDRWRGFVVP